MKGTLAQSLIAPRPSAAPPARDVFKAAEHAPPLPVDVPLGQLRTDGDINCREQLCGKTIETYRTMYVADGPQAMDALEAYFDGEWYWVWDGSHRKEAAQLARLEVLPVKAKHGTLRDAQLAATGANPKHGLPRSNATKRNAVLRLLRDEEWGKWGSREIARQAHVSHTFVDKLRTSGNGCQIDDGRRTVLRGGTQYEIDTSRIGSGPRLTTKLFRDENEEAPGDEAAAVGQARDLAAERRQEDSGTEAPQRVQVAEAEAIRDGLVNWRELGRRWALRGSVQGQPDDVLRKALAGKFRLLLAAVAWGARNAGGKSDKARDAALHQLMQGARQAAKPSRTGGSDD
jgi:hypothetical protein